MAGSGRPPCPGCCPLPEPCHEGSVGLPGLCWSGGSWSGPLGLGDKLSAGTGADFPGSRQPSDALRRRPGTVLFFASLRVECPGIRAPADLAPEQSPWGRPDSGTQRCRPQIPCDQGTRAGGGFSCSWCHLSHVTRCRSECHLSTHTTDRVSSPQPRASSPLCPFAGTRGRSEGTGS